MSIEGESSSYLRLSVITVLTTVFFVSVAFTSTAIAAEAESSTAQVSDSETVLVKYAPGVAPLDEYEHDLISEEFAPVSFMRDEDIDLNAERYWEVEVPEGETASEVIEQLEQDDRVAVVEPNLVRRIAVVPDDSSYSTQWHHQEEIAGINSDTAWDTTTGSADVVVAVIDTGMDMDHPDLAANLWVNPAEIAGNSIDDDGNGYIDDVNGYDFVDEDGTPDPAANGINDDGFGGADGGVVHGTHVAGIIGAVGNNTEGVVGVSWTTSLMILRALDDEGAGTDAWIAEAMRYAVDNGADVINMSLGGYGSTVVLESAAAYAETNGVLIVAAAGNDGVSIEDEPFFPTCYSGVLGIASTDINATASSFSNYGANCVDVAAPGSSIYSTLYTDDASNGFTDDYGYLSGTSMATPVVTGILSLLVAEDSTLTAEQLTDIVVDSAVDIGIGSEYGSGRADAAAAIANIDLSNRPSKPKNLKVFTSSSSATALTESQRYSGVSPYFTWSASTDDSAVVGYYVYFGTNANADPATAGTLQADLFYQASGLEGNSQSYYLIVKAIDDEDNFSGQAASYEYIIDTEVKKAKKVGAVSASKGVKVTWSKVLADSVQKYQVYRKTVGLKGGSFKKVGKVGKKKKQFIDVTAVPDTIYRYRIKAIDDFSNTSNSQAKKITFRAQERIIAAPQTGGTQVRIYNTKKKRVEKKFNAFGAAGFGVELAAGQFDQDRKDEIVTAVAADGPPQVRIYEANGKKKYEFYVASTSFLGGVRVGAGNFDTDALDEIVVGPGAGGSPVVKIFERNGTEIRQFTALDGVNTSGLYVSAVQWNGSGPEEIVVGPGVGGGADVVVYRKNGKELARFQPYGPDFNSGIRVSSAKLGAKSTKESVMTVPVEGTTFIHTFRRSGATGATPTLDGFFGFVSTYDGGGSVAAGDVTNSGKDRFFIGSGGGRQSTVQMYTGTGKTLKDSLFPFGGSASGLNIASGFVY